jgi:hypothetical protein
MPGVVKVYRVKNNRTGLYRTGGGGWSATGKTWNSMAHLKASISGDGWYNSSTEKFKQLPSDDIVIIEIVVQETIGNTMTMSGLVENQRRLLELKKEYGECFSKLVERIEKDGQQDEWQWALVIPLKYGKSKVWEDELIEKLKVQKLKMNTDYRKSAVHGLAVAFKDRRAAMLTRLALSSDVQVISLDLKNFVETHLDPEDS